MLAELRRRSPGENPPPPKHDPDICSQCAYCGTALSTRHEHDHAPIPWLAGGDATVAVCLNCHDLKDRIPLDSWSAEAFTRMVDGTTPQARIFVAKMFSCMCLLAAEGNELKAQLAARDNDSPQ